MDNNKKTTGDYYRNIISVLENRLYELELDVAKYGRFKKFVTGINRNIENTRRSLRYYNNLLSEYIRDGWAE